MTDLPADGGLLLVDKPSGPTSHDVVATARRALGTGRIGHTGTLDPFATGLLVLCVGPATRLSEFLTGLPKRYLARVRLGERSSTDDPEGDIEPGSDAWRTLTRPDLDRALEPLRGDILQTPPVYSAKKVRGESAHYRVRRGEAVELQPVRVHVAALEIEEWRPPELDLDVRCSSGTYVRALARDLGEEVGAGAYLVALRRTAVGPFSVERAISLEALGDAATVAAGWIAPGEALPHLPSIQVDADAAARLAQGQSVPVEDAAEAEGGPVAVLRGRILVAVGERAAGRLHPRKVFQREGSG